jgi:hypothetical protein
MVSGGADATPVEPSLGRDCSCPLDSAVDTCIGIDSNTLKIWEAELTSSDVVDGPMLPELLDQIPSEQEIGSVTADGAFDTCKCHECIPEHSAAVITPPRKDTKP